MNRRYGSWLGWGNGSLVFLLYLCGAVCAAVATAALNVRIPVSQAGMYVISYADLGLDQPLKSSQLDLYNRGEPVATTIDDGDDGQFGPGDSLRFYGRPVSVDDLEFKYSDENIYWLKSDAASGLRVLTWTGGSPGVAESSFRYTRHVEKNWHYWQRLPNGVGLDHWFWGKGIIAGESRIFNLTLNDPVVGVPATVRIALQGATNVISDLDHKTRVSLNGCRLGDIDWDGQVPIVYSFDSDCLVDGANSVTVNELNDHGVIVDSIYVNWIEVDYQRAFIARNDELSMTVEGNDPVTLAVSGFSSNNIAVYDMNNPAEPRRLDNPIVSTSNGLDYSVTFTAPGIDQAHYLAIADGAVMTITKDDISRPGYSENPLTSANNGADYLLITHASLKGAVSRLAQHRAGQGYRVKVVTTEQIYDEFADGLFTPQAIKDFIRHATLNWQAPAPEFVLLVGDANQDYKDHYQTGQINHVPTYLVETAGIGETPSDNWFVTVVGDDLLPDLLIGRIPAKTVDEVRIVTDKIIRYETGMNGPARSRILTAMGDHEPRFADYTDHWLEYLSDTFSRVIINPLDYLQNYLARGDFIRALNEDGVGIVTYFGHGAVDRWVASDDDGTFGGQMLELLASDDMRSLSNDRAYPLFVAFNCLNSFFSLPVEGEWFTLPDGSGNRSRYNVPLAEALLFQDKKGAIAMWSPSAFAYPTDLHWIGHEFFAAIFDRDERILGRIVTQAKVRAYLEHGVGRDNLDIFVLIGDPATRLNIIGGQNTTSIDDGGSGGGGGLSYLSLLVLFVVLFPGGSVVRVSRC